LRERRLLVGHSAHLPARLLALLAHLNDESLPGMKIELTLPSECVSLNGPVWGIFIHPRRSRDRFPRFVERAENSTIVFRAFHKPSFPRPHPLVGNFSGGDLHHRVGPVMLKLHWAYIVQR
jgi:hypothetical protein